METLCAMVGTEKWLLQHEVIEKLNMQAHYCAKSNSDDFVLEALITHHATPDAVSDAYTTAFEDPACLKMILDWEHAA